MRIARAICVGASLWVVLASQVFAQSSAPSEETIRRLEGKLASVCKTLPADEPPYLTKLSKLEIESSCKCAVPNAAKELIENNIREGGVAYYKVAAHMMICNESRLKSKLMRETLQQELLQERQNSFKKSAADRATCLVNLQYELFIDAYQTMTFPDSTTIAQVVKDCRS